MGPPAVVLLSGGLDSATVAAIARKRGFDVHALVIDYGQRHRAELAAAHRVAERLAIADVRVLKLDLRAIGGSALTEDGIAVPHRRDGDPPMGHDEIPVTYVPARNTVFLSLALGFAEAIGSRDLFIGVNAVDYSGYPDCRPEFIRAFEAVAQLATKAGVEAAAGAGSRFTVHAPLLEMSKAEIIRCGLDLGVDYGLTYSCYDPLDEGGRPCGTCDACRLRADGFREAGVVDPARGAT